MRLNNPTPLYKVFLEALQKADAKSTPIEDPKLAPLPQGIENDAPWTNPAERLEADLDSLRYALQEENIDVQTFPSIERSNAQITLTGPLSSCCMGFFKNTDPLKSQKGYALVTMDKEQETKGLSLFPEKIACNFILRHIAQNQEEWAKLRIRLLDQKVPLEAYSTPLENETIKNNYSHLEQQY